jgi:hypothetical protein
MTTLVTIHHRLASRDLLGLVDQEPAPRSVSREAKLVIETRRQEYNKSRPHGALGETPNEIACEFAASREFTSTTTYGNSVSG